VVHTIVNTIVIGIKSVVSQVWIQQKDVLKGCSEKLIQYGFNMLDLISKDPRLWDWGLRSVFTWIKIWIPLHPKAKNLHMM
jgi:hypothetical protein